MKLQSHQDSSLRIVVSLDQSVIGMRHGAEAGSQIANSLVMIAIYAQCFAAIPARERSLGRDGDGMTVGIVIVIVNVRAVRALFLLYVPVERASANDVQQLGSAADTENRDVAAQSVTQ